MPVIINGTTGVTSVNGTAAAPSVTGTDTDTGIVYGTNTVTIATNGTAGLIQNASQNVGIGATPSAWTSSFGIRALQIGTRSALVGSDSNTNLSFNNYFDGTDVRYQANAEASYYLLNGVKHIWYSAPTGTAGNVVTFTQVLSVEKDTSLALQGATTKSGTGITFPASFNASSDANTLDDYEEGVFTPALSFGGGSTGLTYQSQKGQYVKIGKNVYVNLYILLLTKGSSTGQAAISGFPFGTGSTTQGTIDFFIPLGVRGYMNSGGNQVSLYSGSLGNTGFQMYSCNLTGGGNSGLTDSAFANTTELNFNFWYVTNS